MKMKEFGPPGGGARPWRPPLDPPMHYDFQSFQPQQNLQNKWVSKSHLCTIFIASLTLAHILRKKDNCCNGEMIISLETKLLVHSIANLKIMAVSQFHDQAPFLIYGKGV